MSLINWAFNAAQSRSTSRRYHALFFLFQRSDVVLLLIVLDHHCLSVLLQIFRVLQLLDGFFEYQIVLLCACCVLHHVLLLNPCLIEFNLNGLVPLLRPLEGFHELHSLLPHPVNRAL